MNISEVRKREQALIALYDRAKDASQSYSDACKAAADLADTTPAVVRRYIAALASDKANTVMAEAEQLTMLFTALPTIAPDGTTVRVMPTVQSQVTA